MRQEEATRLLNSVGKEFFVKEFELIRNWNGEKKELVQCLFKEGYDANLNGTKTRVNAALRIIENGWSKYALSEISLSRIPDSFLARDLLNKYFYSHFERPDFHVYFDPKVIFDDKSHHAYDVVCGNLFNIRDDIVKEGYSSDIFLPSICLDDRIYKSNVVIEYRENVEPVDGNRRIDNHEDLPDELRCRPCISRDFEMEIEEILLGEFIPGKHTVIIYYKAIEEYSLSHGLCYDAKLISTVVHYVFESFFYRCSKNKQYWSNQSAANGSVKEKNIVKTVIPEFFEYMWCVGRKSRDTIKIATVMYSSWARYFNSTWIFAQTLYFYLTGSPKHYLSYNDARDKHRKVFEYACKESHTPNVLNKLME